MSDAELAAAEEAHAAAEADATCLRAELGAQRGLRRKREAELIELARAAAALEAAAAALVECWAAFRVVHGLIGQPFDGGCPAAVNAAVLRRLACSKG